MRPRHRQQVKDTGRCYAEQNIFACVGFIVKRVLKFPASRKGINFDYGWNGAKPSNHSSSGFVGKVL
jgi:hypothetical protein